jgi:hypothetical protein
MRYTKIDKNNYEEANLYYQWLMRRISTKEQEKELKDLAVLLNDYEVDNLYGDQDLLD